MKKIIFTLSEESIFRSTKLRSVVSNVFGVQVYSNRGGDVHILCRPEQFARFIIERNNRGCTNLVKNLQARYVEAKVDYVKCQCGAQDLCPNMGYKPARGHCIMPVRSGDVLPHRNLYDGSNYYGAADEYEVAA